MTSLAAYLDYNATAPVRACASEAALRAMGVPGNPSSVHAFGRAARGLVEEARETVAALLEADPRGVIFTSGGTEANALAITGWNRRRFLASAIEHPSVLKARPGETVGVLRSGVIDLAALERALAADSEPALVAVMLANNETGVVQPIAEVVRLARAHGALVHCDAVQAVGKTSVDIGALGVDSLALSAHKLGGPTGVGALLLADPDAELRPLLAGGGQEGRRRSGTENLPGIAGFGAAAQAVMAETDEAGRLARLRDRLEKAAGEQAPGLVVIGAGAPRLPNTACLAVRGVSAQTLLMGLDLAGVAVSTGSACSSGKVAPSHVLTAMGEDDLAGSAIRVSLGWASEEQDVDCFLEAFGSMIQRLGAGDRQARVA
ncbi:cysteine desulfurase family protein [Telmatospirillum siberiense]|uniref:Cysteine desulfurase n=1 Tax=Telmatospirillum siberiense TaxID=382514 RepID=A0A2N3PXG5_9PROT|nr:cysteine desulfurase family protein [Telmatospirillum siberiense]PKU25102.1 cysteine desulfurase [Telmatospirillum siberiense]